VLWKLKELEELDKDGKPKTIPYLRYYTVFNAAQIDDIEFPEPAIETIDYNPIDRAESIVAGYTGKPEIKYGFTLACYRPPLDEVNMPAPERFSSAEEHYGTLFHELVHSTGHEKRLARRGSHEVRHFGDEAYSKEELVAEMGAAFLNSEAGIEAPTLENSAAYIQSWLKALKNDSKILIQAASLAQKAADYILGKLSTSCEAAEEGDA
jgi:antirestriction protein ArdC